MRLTEQINTSADTLTVALSTTEVTVQRPPIFPPYQPMSTSNIAGALDIWNRIVSLQPKHSGLLERIARANRFLQRLEELQKAAPANGS